MTEEEFFERLKQYGLDHRTFYYARPLYNFLKEGNPSKLEGKEEVTTDDILKERERYSAAWNRAFHYWTMACDTYRCDPTDDNRNWMEAAEKIKRFVHDEGMKFYAKRWIPKGEEE